MSNGANVLVTGAGSLIGFGCVRALRESPSVSAVYTADIIGGTAAAAISDRFFITPKAADGSFIDELCRIVSHEGIDVVIPCSCFELERLAIDRERIRALVVVEDLQVIQRYFDKYLTSEFLRNMGIPCPRTCLVTPSTNVDDLCASVEFPVFAKPRFGYGSKDADVIESCSDLVSWLDALNREFVLQDYLPDEGGEFSASITYSQSGDVSSVMVVRRDKIRNGVTVCATYDAECQEHERHITEFARELGGRYCLNLQFRVLAGTPHVFEINPRFGASESIRATFGFNTYLDVLSTQIGHSTPSASRRFGKIIRMYEDVFVPGSGF